MRRRQLVVGLGALAGGGGILAGTGAFTSVDADRDVSVAVANEDEAYLKIEPAPNTANGAFANQTSVSDGKRLSLDFNGEIPDRESIGPGQSSEYEFDDVFRITNQGTQTVYVNISDVTTHNGATTVRFYARKSGGRKFITPGNNALEIDTGTEEQIGVYIDTGDESNYSTGGGDSSKGDATITANATTDDTIVSP